MKRQKPPFNSDFEDRWSPYFYLSYVRHSSFQLASEIAIKTKGGLVTKVISYSGFGLVKNEERRKEIRRAIKTSLCKCTRYWLDRRGSSPEEYLEETQSLEGSCRITWGRCMAGRFGHGHEKEWVDRFRPCPFHCDCCALLWYGLVGFVRSRQNFLNALLK